MITFDCSFCGKTFEVEESQQESIHVCDACGASNKVPTLEEYERALESKAIRERIDRLEIVEKEIAKRKKAAWSNWIVGTASIAVLSLIGIGAYVAFVSHPGVDDTSEGDVHLPPSRTDIIEDAFSLWDGSHKTLARIIQGRLRDPASYEHIETRYTDNGDRITIVTRFRAANRFGGKNIIIVVGASNIAGDKVTIRSWTED